MSKKKFKDMFDAAQCVDIPIIVCGDLVNGAGARMYGATVFLHQMGCSATTSQELMEKMG